MRTKAFISTVLTLFFLSILLSCDLFTHSIGSTIFGKNLGRSYEERFSSEENTETLANLASNLEIQRDNNASVALINELSSRPEDEIISLPISAQNEIFNLLVTSAIPMRSIFQTVMQASQEGEDSQSSIIDTLVNVARNVDTTAVAVLLTIPDTLAQADVTSLLVGSIAMITQIIGHELDVSQSSETASDKFEDIQTVLVSMDDGTTAAHAASQAVSDGYISSESQKALEGVLNCILALGGASDLTDSSGNPVDRSGDLKDTTVGDFNFGSLFGISTDNSEEETGGEG